MRGRVSNTASLKYQTIVSALFYILNIQVFTEQSILKFPIFETVFKKQICKFTKNSMDYFYMQNVFGPTGVYFKLFTFRKRFNCNQFFFRL